MQIRKAIPMHGDKNIKNGIQTTDETNNIITNTKAAIISTALSKTLPRFLNFMILNIIFKLF